MTGTAHKYSVGWRVDVYEDPVTRKKLEGHAMIKEIGEVDHHYGVQFFQDVEPPNTIDDVTMYWRFIYH